MKQWLPEEDLVYFIMDVVKQLDLRKIHRPYELERRGQPPYNPTMMVSLLLYAYAVGMPSSRKIEQATYHSIPFRVLTANQHPDHDTIADFRKRHLKILADLFVQVLRLCQKAGLVKLGHIALDGTKMKANASKRKAMSYGRMEKKAAELKKEVKQLNKIETQLKASPDKQISLTDPDARAMRSHTAGLIGYNVQTAVDAKHHLIIAHEVTNEGTDRLQLMNMATQAKQATGHKKLSIVADRGYYNSTEIKACEDTDIKTYLPKNENSSNQAKGFFGKRDFIYNPEKDEYLCPGSEIAGYRFSREEKGKIIRRYWSSACPTCPIKSQCTTGKNRRISRWEHEVVLDRVEERTEHEPERMAARRNTVEHPFGTIKTWMGYTHFQMKTLERVSTEMSLHVLAYNLKRVIKILGTGALIEAMQA